MKECDKLRILKYGNIFSGKIREKCVPPILHKNVVDNF